MATIFIGVIWSIIIVGNIVKDDTPKNNDSGNMVTLCKDLKEIEVKFQMPVNKPKACE